MGAGQGRAGWGWGCLKHRGLQEMDALLTRLEETPSEAARGQMRFWVRTTEGSSDSGQYSSRAGRSPNLHLDTNRAEGHRRRVLAAASLGALGRRGGWLGALGLQLLLCPHFPATRHVHMVECPPSYTQGERSGMGSGKKISVDYHKSCYLVAKHRIPQLEGILDISWSDPSFFVVV